MTLATVAVFARSFQSGNFEHKVEKSRIHFTHNWQRRKKEHAKEKERKRGRLSSSKENAFALSLAAAASAVLGIAAHLFFLAGAEKKTAGQSENASVTIASFSTVNLPAHVWAH